MINKIRELLHRKDQYIYNYNYEIDKFDTATYGLIIRYKKSFRTIILRLLGFGIYVLLGLLFSVMTKPYEFFGFSRFTLIAIFIFLLVIVLFTWGFLFHPRTKTILDELVRQKKLNIISEEKFNDYLDKINSAIENSTASDEHKKEAIEYNNSLR